jgi:hypothetical protein
MLYAKLSTDKTIVFGPVLDSTGAAVTSEVVASIKIMKNGASAAALDAAATLTHSATGVYLLLLKAADISEVGECTVVLNSGTNSASAVRLNVLPATVYAAIVENAVNATGGLVGATAAITTMEGVIATTTNITAGTITTTTNLTNAPTSGDLTATMKASVTTAVPTVANIQSGLATPTNITAGTITTTTNLTNAPTSGDLTATMKASVTTAVPTVASIQSGLATAANLLIVSDGVGFITSVLLGTISDAGTAGETYVITFGGATYTLDYTGLDSTGNRTGVTRTKV